MIVKGAWNGRLSCGSLERRADGALIYSDFGLRVAELGGEVRALQMRQWRELR